MPRRKAVPSLTDLAMKTIGALVREESLRVARITVTKFTLDEHDADEEAKEGIAFEREVYLSDQVELFKQHLLGCVPASLFEPVLDCVLKGINEAVALKKREWRPTTNMTRFTREMYAVVKFSNLLVLPTRQTLDLGEIPKIIRSRLYGYLASFPALRHLSLGSGSGGWVPEAYSEAFLLGIPHMTRLVSFSLKYDCTASVLQVLSETCADTLRVLDIERSRQVRDDSIPYILRCSHLVDISMFQVDLSLRGQAEVLVGLKDLRHLRRGDFLCEVVEYLEETEAAVTLKVQEFWASEEYYFHTDEQLALTAKHCPDIRQMLFMFQPDSSSHLWSLSGFCHLEDLDLWGGSFYADGLGELLQVIGFRLTKLSLVHVEALDKRAIALLTVCAPNLRSLGLHNCEFVEDSARPAGEEQRASRDVQPLIEVREVRIVSDCPSDFIVFVLRQCLNVREISFGMSTGVCDDTIAQVLATNALQHLERLSIQRCKRMTMRGVEMLLANCDNLRVLTDLSYFTAVHELELKKLRARLKEENVDLDTGDAEESREFSEANFMRQALRSTFPALDNSNEWATS